jgi:hypothetical protein
MQANFCGARPLSDEEYTWARSANGIHPALSATVSLSEDYNSQAAGLQTLFRENIFEKTRVRLLQHGNNSLIVLTRNAKMEPSQKSRVS